MQLSHTLRRMGHLLVARRQVVPRLHHSRIAAIVNHRQQLELDGNYCLTQGVPVGVSFMNEIRAYTRTVLSKRA